MSGIDEHFRAGIDLFNRGEFFEAHEEMEEAMSLAEDDGDWDFYLGLLRAAVANHKVQQGEFSSAVFHLGAATRFLSAYPGRHRGIDLDAFRSALADELAMMEKAAAGSEIAPSFAPPQIQRIV